MALSGRGQLVLLAAVIALTVPVTGVALASGTAAQPRSTVFLTSPVPGAAYVPGRLSPIVTAGPRWVATRTPSANGWVELAAAGTTAHPAGSLDRVPDGRGYLGEPTALSGKTVAAGAWRATLSLRGTGAPAATPRVRFWRYGRGRYTLIGSATGHRIVLGAHTMRVTVSLPRVPPVRFGAGDRLYIDLWASVNRTGTAVLHRDNAGAAAAVSMPHPSATRVGVVPTTSPTTAPTPSAPTTTAPPTTVPPTAPRTTAAPTVPTAGSVWKPRPGTTWQWQITGVVDQSIPVTMYDIDLYDAQPASSSYTVPGFGTVHVPQGINAGVIPSLHHKGKVVICYLDSGAWESYRPDEGLFPPAVIGAGTGWDGEHWLDLRPGAWHEFEPLIAARFDLAKRSGCDGVEPDENNPYGNAPGFPIGLADQKAWYLEVAKLAHARGLSVGQKNGIETTDAQTVAAFDWDLNEQCRKYDECPVLDSYIKAGKAVFHAEYQDQGMTTSFCPGDRAEHFSGLLKRLALDSWRQAC